MFKVGDKVVLLVKNDLDMEYGTTTTIKNINRRKELYRLEGYGVADINEFVLEELYHTPLFKVMREDE